MKQQHSLRSLKFLTTCAAALALALAVQAEESKLVGNFAKAKEKVAKEHAKVAKWADKNGLHRYGFLEWSDCLEFDPDQKKARERLGYEKTSTGSWIRSRDMEVKKIDEIDESQRIEWDEQYEAKRAAAKKKALKEFEKILTAAIKEANDDIARGSAKLIRRYDPYHKGAIAALGLEISEDGRVVEPLRDAEDVSDKGTEPPVEEGSGDAPGDVINTAGRGANRHADLARVVAEGASHQWAAKSGLPIKNEESRHHCLLSTEMGQERMKELLEVAEQTRTRWYQRYLIPNDAEFYSRKATLMFLADKEEHQKFCDKVYQEDARDESGFQFRRNRSGGGTYPRKFSAWCHSKGEDIEKDWVIHYTTHLLTATFAGGMPVWMREATAYEQSIGILGTSWSSCINDQVTGQASKDWADPVNWRELVRGLVRLGEDTPFESIAMMKPNEINPKIAAKCWSFLTWILDTQGDKVYNLLGGLRGDYAQQESAFKGILGKSLSDLEEDWRRYVKETY